MIKLTKQYSENFKKLNERQKIAVTTIDGPVVALAGPGTGKTQVLTLRIGQILAETQMNPYNILCLTFTEAAASEMRQRLINLIGHTAYDVPIATFHGFTNSLIQEFSYRFGASSDDDGELITNLIQIDDLDRLIVINNLLNTHPWKTIKPFKQPLYYLKEISKIITDLKRERIDPVQLKQELEVERGKLDEKKDEALKNKIERTIELTDFFVLYQSELAKTKRYDYEDMINWVVDKFSEDSEFLAICQERYQYILVDEYQDTNSSQLALLGALTSHYKTNPNLFVVGDPNQSIYRFQGASSANIAEFLHRYPDATMVNLTQNYRSGQTILDTSRKLISHNDDSKNFIKEKLIANRSEKGKVIITKWQSNEAEIQGIARDIKTLIKKGIQPSEIAILVRTNAQINQFVTALDELAIPSQITKGESVLKNTIIEKILTTIEFALDPTSTVSFAKLLYFLRPQITLADIYKFSRSGPEKTLINLEETNRLKLIPDPDTYPTLQKIISFTKEISLQPPAKAVQTAIDILSILKEIDTQEDRILILEAIKTLLNNAKSSPLPTSDWLKKIRSQQTYNIDMISEPILYGQKEAVVVQTVHQSKGKEYTYVFIPQLKESIWNQKKTELFYIPYNNKTPEPISIMEERRLLFVGITRAKLACYISYPEIEGTKPVLASRFITELSLPEKQITESVDAIIKRTTRALHPIPKSSFSLKEQAWLKELVAKQPLSPTGLCTYKRCPKDFLIKNVLRIPSVKTPSLAYGTAIHGALELFFTEYKNSNQLPNVDEMIDGYIRTLDREIMTQKEREEQLTHGINLLQNFYQRKSESFVAPVYTEYPFGRNIHLGDALLTGKIDKIEWVDPKKKAVRVIDYKTGRVKTRNEMLGKTKNGLTDYTDQLKFYCILGELDHKFSINWQISETEIQFLDEKYSFTNERFTFSQQELNLFKEEVKTVWQNIQDLKFEHTISSAWKCDYCDIITL